MVTQLGKLGEYNYCKRKRFITRPLPRVKNRTSNLTGVLSMYLALVYFLTYFWE